MLDQYKREYYKNTVCRKNTVSVTLEDVKCQIAWFTIGAILAALVFCLEYHFYHYKLWFVK